MVKASARAPVSARLRSVFQKDKSEDLAAVSKLLENFPQSARSPTPNKPVVFSKLLHTFGTNETNLEERKCLNYRSRGVKKPYVSPFASQKHAVVEVDSVTLPTHIRAPSVGKVLRRDEVIAQARRRIIGAKVSADITWDDVFADSDRDKSNTLDFRELKQAMRKTLHTANRTDRS